MIFRASAGRSHRVATTVLLFVLAVIAIMSRSMPRFAACAWRRRRKPPAAGLAPCPGTHSLLSVATLLTSRSWSSPPAPISRCAAGRGGARQLGGTPVPSTRDPQSPPANVFEEIAIAFAVPVPADFVLESIRPQRLRGATPERRRRHVTRGALERLTRERRA